MLGTTLSVLCEHLGRASDSTHSTWLAVGDLPVLLTFAVVTQLGDVWFLFLLGATLYVAGEEFPRFGLERRQGLFVLALAVAYVALIGVLKGYFEIQRPPGAGDPPPIRWVTGPLRPIFVDITTATGPSFPSGHALGSTMVWGGVGLVFDRFRDRWRVGVPAAIVATVATSRVVLGVHYPIDVAVGVASGVVALAILYWATDRGTDPQVVLFVATVVGVIGLLDGLTFESVAAVGTAAGSWLAWLGVAESTPATPNSRREVAAGFLPVVAAALLFGAAYATHPSAPVTFFGTAAAGGLVVLGPLLGDRLA